MAELVKHRLPSKATHMHCSILKDFWKKLTPDKRQERPHPSELALRNHVSTRCIAGRSKAHDRSTGAGHTGFSTSDEIRLQPVFLPRRGY